MAVRQRMAVGSLQEPSGSKLHMTGGLSVLCNFVGVGENYPQMEMADCSTFPDYMHIAGRLQSPFHNTVVLV